MSHAKARISIETKILQWANSRTPPIPAFFGVQKAETTKPIYIHGHLLPASARTECLQGDEIAYLGLYQVNITCYPDQPLATAESVVSEMQSLFPVDSDIGTIDFNGSISDAIDQGPTVVDDSRYTIPVTIPYRGVVTT